MPLAMLLALSGSGHLGLVWFGLIPAEGAGRDRVCAMCSVLSYGLFFYYTHPLSLSLSLSGFFSNVPKRQKMISNTAATF
jgi:hypothetical protein